MLHIAHHLIHPCLEVCRAVLHLRDSPETTSHKDSIWGLSPPTSVRTSAKHLVIHHLNQCTETQIREFANTRRTCTNKNKEMPLKEKQE